MADKLERVEIEDCYVFTHIDIICPNEECLAMLNEEIEGDKTEDAFEEEIKCQYCQKVFIGTWQG